MLTSRLEAVFDEFLHKVKEEFQMAKTTEIDQKKIKKNLNAPNYGYKEDKSSRLDNRPSYMFKKRNVLPGWYSPLQSPSTEIKTRYPKKFGKLEKPEKNHANATCMEELVENMNRRKDELRELRELRKRDYAAPTTNVEPHIKRCTCKLHKNDTDHIYDIPTKTRYSRNSQNFRTEGASMTRSKLRPDYLSKKTPMSAFTITSASLTHSSS